VVQSLEQTTKPVRFKDTKTSRSRAITLPAFAIKDLRRLRRQQALELLHLGIRQTGDIWSAAVPTGNHISRAACPKRSRAWCAG
jgi:hypothetical protein